MVKGKENAKNKATTASAAPAKETKETKKASNKKVAEPVAEPAAEPTPAPAKKNTKSAASKAADKKAADKKAEKPTQQAQEGGEQTEKKTKKRYFRAIYKNEEGEIVCEGRYSGKKPKQAASKALTGILKLYKSSGIKSDKVKFGVIECTRGSRRKRYYYQGEKSQLPKPLIVKITKKDGKQSENTLSDSDLQKFKDKKKLSTEDIKTLTANGFVVYNNNNCAKKITDNECPDLSNFKVNEKDLTQEGGEQKIKAKAKPKAKPKANAKGKKTKVVPKKATKAQPVKQAKQTA